jgi:hypothetical protein
MYMVLSGTDKRILETLFDMSGGYVLDFSNRTMGEFFLDNFGIAIYDEKYNIENLTDSKANRLRGIWAKEDEQTVGKIIQSLTEYIEISSLTGDKEISQNTILLIQKARDIAQRLLVVSNDQAEVQKLIGKATALRNFNGLSFAEFSLNEKIYLLKVLWSFYEGIVRSYYGDGVIFLGSGIDDLNDSFKTLRKKMIELIASDTSFEELKGADCYQAIIDPMGSLYFSSDFLDGTWEAAVERYLVNFREIIADRDLFENASEAHKLHSSISQFLEFVKKELGELIDTVREQREAFDRRHPPLSSEDLKEEKIIKHEHTHRFEEGVQEQEKIHRVEVVNPYLNVKVQTNTIASKVGKFPVTLKSGTQWKDITIVFEDERNVIIHVKGQKVLQSCEEMKFVKGNKAVPTATWNFLEALARQNGEIFPKDNEAKPAYKKQKELLTSALKAYFRKEEDPFFPYDSSPEKRHRSYKTRFGVFYKAEEKEKPDKFADLGLAMSQDIQRQ